VVHKKSAMASEIILKTPEEIARMRAAGLVVWHGHQAALAAIRPGVTTAQIDAAVEAAILESGAEPLFKGVPGPVVAFPAATCVSVNDEVVHGIPSRRKLRAGDVVSVDIGARVAGWCADGAATYPVGEIDEGKQRLLTVTRATLELAVEELGRCQLWSEVARKMEKAVKSARLSVVQELAGHGIGRKMWEEPSVPNYFRGYHQDFRIEPGLVIAVEPMVNLGTRAVEQMEDHWTIVTKDGAPSAHFEHTIAITKNGPVVLTAGPNGRLWV
jgi:methionyl aminopeptidase